MNFVFYVRREVSLLAERVTSGGFSSTELVNGVILSIPPPTYIPRNFMIYSGHVYCYGYEVKMVKGGSARRQNIRYKICT
jgi:hypothetical protein